MLNLDKIRNQIDSVDDKMLELIQERMRLIENVTKTKINDPEMKLRHIEREKSLLSILTNKSKKVGLDPYHVYQIFKAIIDYSVDDQYKVISKIRNEKILRVAYQGVTGAYSYLASQKFFSRNDDNCQYKGYRTFQEAVHACERDEVDYVVLPIENTIGGSINSTYRLLDDLNLSIVGDVLWPVDHCLIALDKIPVSKIRRVLSHPQALLQCGDYLSQLSNCTIESYYDTAEAVKMIKDKQINNCAAIASESTAALYDMEVIKTNIADSNENYTRFIVLSKKSIEYDKRIPCKTSLLLITEHAEGALLSCLEVFHRSTINILKLESRPIPNIKERYQFYIDIEGNVVDSKIRIALDEIRKRSTYLKVFGSYPSKTIDYDYSEILNESAEKVAILNSQESEKSVCEGKKSYRLAAKTKDKKKTVIDIQGIKIGGDSFTLIAGPCAVESASQINECARTVRMCGGTVLRGGVFKPRSSPYAFQGLGYEGLEYLYEAGNKYNIPIITEVLHPKDVKRVAEYADILQIGARNMQNYSLLNEVGKCKRPVLLKRGLMSTIEELLMSAEYILSNGNSQVILCERGIRTFEKATRNTLDLQAIPVIKKLTHLPVIVDPSHAAGSKDIITPMSLAALAAGADGIMVEIHPQPESALCDGNQSLDIKMFMELSEKIRLMSLSCKGKI